MPSPFFSIIIPSFNAQDKIQTAFDSVLRQKFTDFEIVVIDGLSKDNTLNIVKENAQKDRRIVLISEKDNGIYDAMNKGINLAKGKWLYFLGSDDYLYNENVLQLIYDNLSSSHCDLIYGNILSKRTSRPYDGPFTLEKLFSGNISHQAIFYNKNIFNLVGTYNLKYKTHADWEFNIRCFSNNNIITKYIDVIVAEFAVGGASSSHEVLFFREVLTSERLKIINSKGPHYLRNIKRFDEWWRFIRNAEIRKEQDISDYAKHETIPVVVKNIIRWQRQVNYRLLKLGTFSKVFMSTSYLYNRLSGAI